MNLMNACPQRVEVRTRWFRKPLVVYWPHQSATQGPITSFKIDGKKSVIQIAGVSWISSKVLVYPCRNCGGLFFVAEQKKKEPIQ